jgi:deazaflavin-dependent oxidoreductase (nitroreductase family)
MVDRRGAAGWQQRFNRFFVWLFRLRRGRLAYRKNPFLVLHTVGRRTGQPRQTPLLYLPVGDGRLALIASNGGDDRTPAWCLNLMTNPCVEAEVGRERRSFTAALATDIERAELWPRVTTSYSGYTKYQTRTDRVIPVVLLSPCADTKR